LHKTTFGCHGSFLLINGSLENQITWDMAGLAEDFEFALRARAHGHRCGEIRGVAREQSPHSLLDFLRQRRRWFLGIRTIRHPCARYVCFQAFAGSLCTLYCILSLLVPSVSAWYQFPLWTALMTNFQLSVFVYIYILGVVIQDVDAGYTWATVLSHIPTTAVFMPMATVLEMLAVFYAIFFKTTHFEVVEK
jgi:cellulose synthase/poly-beta-1,6-N-acetylglucosamine synthase-like glycosyltransferase